MKSTKKIIALALAIVALVMASCPQESKSEDPAPKTDPALNGTWAGSRTTWKFNNGTFEALATDGRNYQKGTFTTSGSSMTLTLTHMWGKTLDDSLEAKWYSKQDLKAPAVLAALSDDDHTVTAEDIDALFASTATFTYAISGSTLTLTWEDGSSDTYTKQ